MTGPGRAGLGQRVAAVVGRAAIVAVTGFVAVTAFVLAYDGSRGAAVDAGIAAAGWYPFCIEGVIVCASVATIALAGRAYPWVILLLFSAVSVAANVLHAAQHPGAHVWSLAFAAVPPLTLPLCVHLVLMVAAHTPDTAPDTGAGSGPATADTRPDGQPDTAPDSGAGNGRTPRRPVAGQPAAGGTAVRVARLRSRHPDMPTAEIARRLGVSDRTVRRCLSGTGPDTAAGSPVPALPAGRASAEPPALSATGPGGRDAGAAA
jgi:hypothetical protein